MAILYIAFNDLKIILKDRKAAALLILMPIILTTVLSTALASSFQPNTLMDSYKVPLAVVKGELSDIETLKTIIPEDQLLQVAKSAEKLDINQLVLEELLSSSEVQKVVDYQVLDRSTALSKLNAKEVSNVILLPDHFASQVMMGKNVEVQILSNTDRNLDRIITHTLFNSLTNALSIPLIGRNVLIEQTIQEGLGNGAFSPSELNIAEFATKETPTVEFQSIAQQGKKLISSREFYVISMAVMFMLFAASYGANNVLTGRKELTLSRIMITGVNKRQILAGKFLFTWFLCFMQLTILFCFGYLAFGITWDSRFLLLLLLLSSSFSIAGLSVFLCGIVKTTTSLTVYQSLIINALSLLGGNMIPVYILPRPFKFIAKLTPNGRALEALISLREGVYFNELIPSILILLGFGSLCFLLGNIFFQPAER